MPSPSPSPNPTPTPDPDFPEGYSGHATRTNEVDEPSSTAEIRISGRVCADALDLGASSLVVSQLLDEAGSGELVADLPMQAVFSVEIGGTFFLDCTTGPSCTLSLQSLGACTKTNGDPGEELSYLLKVDRSQDERAVPITYLRPPNCVDRGTTEATVSFTIDDGVAGVALSTTDDWRCSGRGEEVRQLTTP